MRGGPRRLGWVRLPCAPAIAVFAATATRSSDLRVNRLVLLPLPLGEGWGEGPAAARYLVVGRACVAEGPHPNPLPPGEGTGAGLRPILQRESESEASFYAQFSIRKVATNGLQRVDHRLGEVLGASRASLVGRELFACLVDCVDRRLQRRRPLVMPEVMQHHDG